MDVKDVLRRESQLNLIAYLIILALITVVALLVFLLLNGLTLPDILPLTNYFARTMLVGLTLGVVLYLVDQHRRLRKQLVEAHQELERAKEDICESYDRLAFAHYAATLMTSLSQDDGLKVVLREAADHFDADAAAVVGDEVSLFTRPAVDETVSQSELLQVSLDAVRAGKPISTGAGENDSAVIAVPLRVKGQLKAVAALWRREGAFTDDQLDGLGLLARIIELSIENRELLGQTESQLEGTLRALGSLVEDIRPDYVRHATRVAGYSSRIGEALGMTLDERRDLKLAGLLHDVGLLRVGMTADPQLAVSGEERARIEEHAAKGAEIARLANFPAAVQQAILTHHERLDGTGYPNHLVGERVPQSGRILAVVEMYDSMTRRTYAGGGVSPREAIHELTVGAGTKFDPRVVKALVEIVAADRRQAEADTDTVAVAERLISQATDDLVAEGPTAVPVAQPSYAAFAARPDLSM